MDFRVPGNRQTTWACGPQGAIWYANLHADIEDQIVVENAKRIVDKALPQKQPTFFGGHYYSFFLTREYLLNRIFSDWQAIRFWMWSIPV